MRKWEYEKTLTPRAGSPFSLKEKGVRGIRTYAKTSLVVASVWRCIFLKGGFIILHLLLFVPVQAQILEHPKGRFFGDKPFFNEEFIRRNDIAKIKAEISKKREMDRVRESGTEHYYEFDRKGRLQRQYESYVHHDSIRDTTFIDYEYAANGKLSQIRRNDLNGFFAYEYRYDSLGRLKKERYLRIENEGPSRYEFNPGERYIIDTETYEYRRPNDTMLVQDFHNSEDRIYRRKIYYRDTLGYLERVTSRFMITHKQGVTRYEYDKKGRVIERMEDPDVSDSTKKSYRFEYDEVGNLKVRDIYRNGKRTYHHEYLYRDSTMLLDAEIKKEEKTMLITITRFKYEFYERPRKAPVDSAKGREGRLRKGEKGP